ncbi:uncharacterized protein LOC113794816 [Dermatophagoides pteronyssinus]|uniref:Uncharacterized protein LOC113794816 n=2 Tax=Dermatophagoides pteronyssinus TaxID=6956 RepID=A0A6P6Y5T2_DERPT|nr:uncharacterized protein LOC113794816 [Dermatophagoides pteronyssinus]KAH9419071.1 hypothetical protein DERP_011166 [Dermatophagoides pteronyssinus]
MSSSGMPFDESSPDSPVLPPKKKARKSSLTINLEESPMNWPVDSILQFVTETEAKIMPLDIEPDHKLKLHEYFEIGKRCLDTVKSLQNEIKYYCENGLINDDNIQFFIDGNLNQCLSFNNNETLISKMEDIIGKLLKSHSENIIAELKNHCVAPPPLSLSNEHAINMINPFIMLKGLNKDINLDSLPLLIFQHNPLIRKCLTNTYHEITSTNEETSNKAIKVIFQRANRRNHLINVGLKVDPLIRNVIMNDQNGKTFMNGGQIHTVDIPLNVSQCCN